MSTTPFLRLFLAFSIGIGLQLWLSFNWQWMAGLVLSSLAGMMVIRLFSIGRQYALRSVRSVCLYLLICCSGGLLVWLKDAHRQPDYFGRILYGKDSLLVSLQEPLQEKARSLKTVAEVHALIRNGKALRANGKLLLYFQRDTAAIRLTCGDMVLICGEPGPVSSSGNPGAFDYRQYCAARQIFYQAFIRAGYWKRSSLQAGGLSARCLLPARNWCIRTLQRYLGKGPEAALAAALLIGYRYDLDKDMVQAYTNAGVVHIIAISGMHLALIYSSLLWLLQWWPSHRYAGLIKMLLICVLLWGFTLLAGAAASILRAAVMFTVIAAGELLLRRYTNIYNTLAASAFLLLCYDPWLLLDAGFQLSYLAVLGILLCYRPLYELWSFPWWWLDKLWQAAAVSLAAQALTLPVCLYYFHQFPNLFLPANLVIVALSTIILYGLILVLLLSPFPIAAHYTGVALRCLISWMNQLAVFIESLPYAVTNHIYMPLYATVFAYMIMAALLALWLGKWKPGMIVALVAGLCWSGVYAADIILAQGRRMMIVYNVPDYTAVDVIRERRLQFAGDTGLFYNKALAERYLQPSRQQYLLKSSLTPTLQGFETLGGLFVSTGNKRLVIVDSTWRPFIPLKKFHTDYLLLSHHPKLTIMQLKDMFVFKMIIFDASNPLWQIQQWKNDCSALTLRCFSVPDQGAYLINF
ncbi:MAG TPA: ComEC/Rec2 family competence protein [Chitinophaga sp.]